MVEKRPTMRDDVNVLVTGMGAFSRIPVNASDEIVKTLPNTIAPSVDSPLSGRRRINLIVHKPAIETSYRDVRLKIPPFLADNADKGVDLILHVGSGYPTHYTIETQSFRDDYNTALDADGELARDLADLPGGEHLWRDTYHGPDILQTAIQPVEELRQRVQSLLGLNSKADVRLSDNPGKFMCGFIYYASLVERWRHNEQMNVILLHVRSGTDEKTLEEGREVVLALIKAAIDMMVD